jgi:F-type H+-transporting ATPase subunit b
MLNGWFTIVAQAVNFLILVWLLKRFLYKPILRAIDEREQGIATQLAGAEAKVTAAQQERDDFQHKNEAFDQERAALWKSATDGVEAERQRLLDKAREEANSLRAKRQEALRDEQRNLSQDIIRWTQKEVFAITRKMLTDLAASSLEERLSEMFVGRLRGLTGEAKDRFAAALKTPSGTALVRTAFALPQAQRTAIESAIQETFDVPTPLQFQTAAELVCGVELSANGQKVAWSITDYLATLEKSVNELWRVDANADAEPDAQSQRGPQSAVRAQSLVKADARPGLEPAASALKGRP